MESEGERECENGGVGSKREGVGIECKGKGSECEGGMRMMADNEVQW